MKLHQKKPAITKRKMTTWKAKGKEHNPLPKKPGFLATVASGARIIGCKIASGVKTAATAENREKLGNWGNNVGDFMQSRSFGYEVPSKKRKRKKGKKR